MDYLQAAPASAGAGPDDFRSFTTFVDVSDGAAQTVRLGVWNPADYAPLNPQYALGIQTSLHDDDARTLVLSNWADRDDGNGGANIVNTQDVTTIATNGQTGAIFGTAWSSIGDRVFTAAFAKAFTSFGPAGPGAVYVTDPHAATPNASPYVVIPDAGSVAHDDYPSTNHDDPMFAAAGTESLGGMALSDDDRTLYVVNMNDKKLYEVDATGATGSIVGSVPITDPGCVGGQWRPGAVTVRDGEVYVGGVCDASDSMDRSDLSAYVLRLDGTTFETVLEQPLNFPRGQAENGGTTISRQWNPWLTTWSRTAVDGINPPPSDSANVKYPTPLLTTLEFDVDGSLFLGFRDRFSDQLGAGGLEPGTGTNYRLWTISAGDLNKACINPDGTYSWEGTNGCPNNAPVIANGGQDPDVVEFFAGDWISLNGSETSGNHHEVAQGGIAFAPRNGEIGSTAMDPTGLVGSGGIGFFNTTTGEGPGGAPTTRGWLVNNYPESFSKGNGLGDIDLIGAAPIQIGNRVWYDADDDGIQGADESSVPGVTVSLVDSSGTVVATTTTNSDGEYYFGGDGSDYQLLPGTDYTVRFDVSTANTTDLPGAPPTDRLTYTITGAGDDRSLDSNPTTTTATPGIGEAPVTTPSTPGAVDHTIDAGVHLIPPSVSVGDYVWVDQDGDGTQDAGEPGIPGVVLVLTGPDGNPVTDIYGNPVEPVTTDADGGYSFDDLPTLPAGDHYTVTIDQDASADALEPYVPTTPGVGPRDTDSSTGSAESVDLTADGDRDSTLDFGFIAATIPPPTDEPTDSAGNPSTPVSPTPTDEPTGSAGNPAGPVSPTPTATPAGPTATPTSPTSPASPAAVDNNPPTASILPITGGTIGWAAIGFGALALAGGLLMILIARRRRFGRG